jgi:protein-S-isoprenylcysteine O-methyltransferase Ste14
MDTARRVIGVLLVVAVPPAILFWLLIHPLAAFWRRLGPAVTYSLVGLACAGAAFLLYGLRDALLGRDLGARWPLVASGGALYALTVWLDALCRRHLNTTALLGAPELSQDAYPGRLLQDGIYRVIRHPRYLSVIVGTLAFALVANYLGAYLVLVVCLPVLYPVIVLEERELVRRFGRDYEEYRARVPAIVPRWRPFSSRTGS